MINFRNLFRRTNNNENKIPLQTLLRFPSIIIEKYKTGKIQYNIERYHIKPFLNKKSPYVYVLEEKRQIYSGSNNYLLLYYEETPVALIGFNYIKNDTVNNTILSKNKENKKEVIIKQIQSILKYEQNNNINNRNFYLEGFDLQKTLIEILETYLITTNQIKQIWIQSAANNIWLRKESKKGERGYNIYDKNAQEFNYIFDPKTRNYYKDFE